MGRYGHLLKGSKVEVTSNEKGFLGSRFLVTVVYPPENPASRSKKKRMTLVEYDTLVNEDGTMLLREKVDSLLLHPVPPRTSGDRGFEVGDCVDAFEKDGWWTGFVKRSVGVKKEGDEESYVVWFEEPEVEVEFGRAELRLHLNWKDGKWYRLRDEDHQELLVRSDGFVDVSNSSCSCDPEKVIELDKPAPTGLSADLCTGMTSLDEQSPPLNRQLSPCSYMSFCREIIDLECPNSSSTHSYPTKKLKRKCVEDSLVHDNGILEESTDEESDVASFCLRPALTLRDNGAIPLRDCDTTNVVSSIKSASNEKDDANSHADTSKRRGECSEEIHVVVATGTFPMVSISCKQLSLEVIEPYFVVKFELQEADDVSKKSSMEEESLEAIGTESTDEEQGDAQKVNSVAVDDNPSMEEQSLAAVGTESTNMEPGHSHLLKNDGMSQGREATIVGLSNGQQPARDDVEMTQSLPFVKSSPIWKHLESLEIFQKFPQKPHFLPLIEAGERTREGYAIANMVTFASTVEDAIKLSVNDPMSTITDCLETFHQLKSHGFDAKAVENRLRKLLSLKEKQQMMDETKNKVERQISELTHKRVKLAADIYEIDHKIKLYEQQLALAFLEEEEVDHKISILKTSLDLMETMMHNTPSCLTDENSPL